MKKVISKWTEEEVKHLMMCVEASDEETMKELYEYVHHMMYNEGNHPDFPVRTLSAITAKIRKVCRERSKRK
jgi:hypothetical protein